MSGSPAPGRRRRLLLLRHGRPVPPAPAGSAAGPAASHALDDAARRDAQRHGARLARRGTVPEIVLAIPGDAALLAAQRCAKAMGIPVAAIRTDGRLESPTPDAMRALLAELPVDLPDDARHVLVVGDRRLRALGCSLLGARLTMPPSSLVDIAVPDWGLATGSARLRRVVEAGDLSRRFPFPFPDGPERRRRPAYYYDQAAAIPVRRTGAAGAPGRLEVLLVSSGDRKHWGIPKGVVEPGFTLAEAAAREVLEEAGVDGTIRESVGSYAIEKWGARFEVATFLLEVERILEEPDWKEPHRERVWLEPAEAAARVKARGLAAILASLARG